MDIMMAIARVGMIIAMPSGRQNMHQAISLNSQNTICKFSILRYLIGIAYTSLLMPLVLGKQIYTIVENEKPGNASEQVHNKANFCK